jgi:glutamate 5-kinase
MIVVKLGTSLIVDDRGRVRARVLRSRAREIATLVRGGEPVCVVSSGAIALGLGRLGLKVRPRSIARLQAASALGQARLQRAWEQALAAEGLRAAQILLAGRDVADRATYVNARRVLSALFAVGVVPVVNENDATATDEITFGDNDALAAQVAILIGARLLVLLTEVEGVFSSAPGMPGAELVDEGEHALGVVFGKGTTAGRGGMQSKVAAAHMASAAGIATVIGSGHRDTVLGPIVAGERRGTRFRPADRSASAFKLWLRHGKPPSGRLVVDEGAQRAVVDGGASLLAIGVVACEGAVRPGDAVELVGPDGRGFGKGIVDVDAAAIAARPRGVEAVHRDRLVLY